MKVLDGAKRWYDYTDFALDGLFDEFLDDDTNGNPTHLWRTITVRGTDQGTGGDKPDNLGTAHWGPHPFEVCRRTLVLALLGSPWFYPEVPRPNGEHRVVQPRSIGEQRQQGWQKYLYVVAEDVMNPNKATTPRTGLSTTGMGAGFSASRPNGMRMREFTLLSTAKGSGIFRV